MYSYEDKIRAVELYIKLGKRMLPNDFPPYQTVYYWFRRLMRRMLFKTIDDLALMLDQMCSGRDVVPGVVGNQSVKAPAAHEQGYDANKKIKGRKRHIAVDTDGRLLALKVTAADIADSTGARLVSMPPECSHFFRSKFPHPL